MRAGPGPGEKPAALAPSGARAGPVGALGGALLAIALLFDAEPLYVPGLALLMLPGFTLLWIAAVARGLRARRSLDVHRVVEGEALEVRLEVSSGHLPLPPCQVLDPCGGIDEPLPAGRSRARLRTEVRFPRRGRRTLGPVRVAVRDPLGLGGREVEVPDGAGEEVLVLPAVHPLRSPPEGARGERRRAGAQATAVSAGTEMDGVGSLREGTPASRIFWPSMARGGEPLERRTVAEGDARPLVVLDLGGAEEEAADASVRAAASLAVALARAGGCAVLLPGDRRPTDLGPGLRSWSRLHARLAVATGGPPLADSATGRHGPLVVVCARPVQRPPRALGHASTGARRLLVVPGTPPATPPAGARAVFTLAGCTGYDITSRRAGPGRARREAAA